MYALTVKPILFAASTMAAYWASVMRVCWMRSMRLLPVMREALHALRGAGKAFIVAAGSGGFHMTDDVQDMIQRLRLAHRIHNPVATLRMCDEAADMISDLAGRLEAAEAKKATARKSPAAD